MIRYRIIYDEPNVAERHYWTGIENQLNQKELNEWTLDENEAMTWDRETEMDMMLQELKNVQRRFPTALNDVFDVSPEKKLIVAISEMGEEFDRAVNKHICESLKTAAVFGTLLPNNCRKITKLVLYALEKEYILRGVRGRSQIIRDIRDEL